MNEEVLAAMSLVLFALVPIVYILVKHQQTMARIIHENKGRNDDPLRGEVEQLKQIVMQQTIALDTLAQQHRQLLSQTSTPPAEPLSARQG